MDVLDPMHLKRHALQLRTTPTTIVGGKEVEPKNNNHGRWIATGLSSEVGQATAPHVGTFYLCRKLGCRRWLHSRLGGDFWGWRGR
jgi:hypothetical protein